MKKLFPLFLLLTFCSKMEDNRDKSISLNHEVFEPGSITGIFSSAKLIEISGIENSYVNPGYFWGHNDSGDTSQLILFDLQGEVLKESFLSNARNIDWEDITAYQDSVGSWLIIADIGDNMAQRDTLTLYKIKEPTLSDTSNLVLAEEMTLSYAEGPRDAETLFYDFQSGNLILVTKREEDVLVYEFRFEANTHKTINSLGSLPFRNFTAGDANEAGEILVKNYDNIFYWSAKPGRLVENLLNGPDFRIPYKREPQGEAICWFESDFITSTEKNELHDQHIFMYRKK